MPCTPASERVDRFFGAPIRTIETPRAVLLEARHQHAEFVRAHWHAQPYISIVLDGAYTEVRDGTPQRMDAGTIVIHPAREEHSDYFLASGRVLNVTIDNGDLLESIADGAHPAADLPREQLAALIDAIARNAGRSRVQALVESLVRALAPAKERRVPSWIHDAIDAVDWTAVETFDGTARHLGVHPTHFSRSFREHTGMTPRAFRQRARVCAASHLLLGSHFALAHVAAECGFVDQSHLTRAFSEVVGLTPGRYRAIFSR
jgi:AraC family transcriptional regulator